MFVHQLCAVKYRIRFIAEQKLVYHLYEWN